MLSKKLAPKHQKLIRQCYPPGRAPEKRPNASELSYLLYYVSTRKVKLQKVAAYLEKSARSDLYKEKIGNMQVTLAIIDALIERCYSDLNLFADAVVEIISLVITSCKDVALCQHACQVFKTFCKYHDGALFSGSDSNFVSSYHGLVSQFAGLPEQNKSIATTATAVKQWERIAINSAEAVSASPAMGTPAGQVDIGVIVRLALKNLCIDDDGSKLLEMQWQQENSMRVHRLSSRKSGADWNFFVDKFEGMDSSRRSMGGAGPAPDRNSRDDNTEGTKRASEESKNSSENGRGSESDTCSPDSDPILISSLHTLTNLLDTTVTVQVRKTSHKVLQFIIDNKAPPLWSTTLVGLMAQWTPVQLRFVIVDTLVDMGVELQLTQLDQQLTVVRLVCSLLSSSVNLVGLSVMDILRVLTSHQHTILLANIERKNGDEAAKASDLLLSMRDAISALATHIYYGDQVSDMISESLSFIQDAGTAAPSINGGVVESSALTHIRSLNAKIVLNDLSNIINIIQVASSTLSKGSLNHVPIQVWLDSDLIIAHEDPRVPQAYVDSFTAFLKSDLYELDRSVAKASSKFIPSENMQTLNTMIQVVATLVSSEPSFKPHNYSASYQWILSCIKYVGPVAALQTTPNMLTLYAQGQSVEHNNGALTSGGCSKQQGSVMCSFALLLLLHITKKFNQTQLSETMTQLIRERQSTNSFLDVSVRTDSANLDSIQASPTPAPLNRAELQSQLVPSDISPDDRNSLFGLDTDLASDSDNGEFYSPNSNSPMSPTIPELLMTRSRSVRGSSISMSAMTDSINSAVNGHGSGQHPNNRREFSPKVSDLKRAIAQSTQTRSQQPASKPEQSPVPPVSSMTNGGTAASSDNVNIDQLLNGLNLGNDGLLTGKN